MTVYVKKEEIFQQDENVKRVKNNIVIEIIAVLTLLSITLTSGTSKTLGLEKICNFNFYGHGLCYNLRIQSSGRGFDEGVIYEVYTSHLMWWTAVQAALSCVVLAFLGGWSDKTGRRKVILLLPVIGVFLQIINGSISTIFFYELPFEFFLFFDAFFGSIVGYSIVFLGIFTYLYDVTPAENRMNRFTSVLLCALAGIALGSVLSRLLLHHLGYYAAYGVAFITNLINRNYINKKLEDPFRTNEQIVYDEQNCKEFMKTFFDCSTIKQTVKVVTKVDPNKRNVRMYVYLATLFILFISVFGERSFLDVITRYDFSWNTATINVFNFYSIATKILGIWIATAVISNKFKHHDAVIGVTSCVSKILSAFVFAFAAPDDIFYFGPAIDALNGTGLLAIIFMLSKLIEENEIGKIASLIAIVENISRLMYQTLYYVLYMHLVYVFPGAIFLVGAGITMPALVAFIWVLRKEKREGAMQTTMGDSIVKI